MEIYLFQKIRMSGMVLTVQKHFSTLTSCCGVLIIGFGSRCGKPKGPRDPPSEWT